MPGGAGPWKSASWEAQAPGPQGWCPPCVFRDGPSLQALVGDLTWDRCSGAGSVPDAGQRVSSRPGDGWKAAHLSLGFGPAGAAPDTCLCCNWLSPPVGGASVPWSSGTLGHVMAAPYLFQGKLCLPQWTRGSQARGLGKALWRVPAPPWGTFPSRNLCVGRWFAKRSSQGA